VLVLIGSVVPAQGKIVTGLVILPDPRLIGAIG
jgi:hypothetical protein